MGAKTAAKNDGENARMEITQAQYEQIADFLPLQRGNVRLNNLDMLNAILYVAEQGGQMARAAEALRELAHNLYADESLEQEWRDGSRV
jgi:hypothetical protein